MDPTIRELVLLALLSAFLSGVSLSAAMAFRRGLQQARNPVGLGHVSGLILYGT
jgi:hypothetical protein